MGIGRPPKTLALFAIGAASFAVSEILWLAIRTQIDVYSRWVLEPTEGLILSAAIMVVTAFSGGLWVGRDATLCIRGAVNLYVGVMTSITVSLFFVGPGNIWPIVLVIAAAVRAAMRRLQPAPRRLDLVTVTPGAGRVTVRWYRDAG